jgi:hypothetical protein
MSETNTDNEWVLQGWYGDMAIAIAAKLLIDLDPRAGIWGPAVGLPPMNADEGGTDGMFGVATRRSNPIPCPEGMKVANSAMLGRMLAIGA